jgi:membrane protein required for colicin V production
MQTYDLLMLLVLIVATSFGFWKGMAWQLASLASLVVSYFVALRFSAKLAPMVGDSAPWNRFVAMLVIYIVTAFVIWMLFRVVAGIIDRVKLESFDRQLGALFGLAKGVLLCIAITFFAVTLLPQPQKETIVASRAGHYIVVLLDKTDTVVPPEIHEIIGPYIHRIEERLDPNYQPAQGHAPSDFPSISPDLMDHSVQTLWRLESARQQQSPDGPQQLQPHSGWPLQEPLQELRVESRESRRVESRESRVQR